MARPSRIMVEVCQKCFAGEWQAMLKFARQYDPTARAPGVWLGRQFREIIGTRNRTRFWESVTKCDVPKSTEEIVDGDSLSGLQSAIKRCQRGEAFAISLNGTIVGKLIPIKP